MVFVPLYMFVSQFCIVCDCVQHFHDASVCCMYVSVTVPTYVHHIYVPFIIMDELCICVVVCVCCNAVVDICHHCT